MTTQAWISMPTTRWRGTCAPNACSLNVNLPRRRLSGRLNRLYDIRFAAAKKGKFEHGFA
jgi:hypothetical protein